MAQYANIAAEIQAAIKTNGEKDITGQVLQIVLLDLLTSLTKGYQFQGAATPDTTPTTGDENIFYLASTPGTYTAFGGFALPVGSLAVLYYDSAWHAALLPLTGMVQAVGAYDRLIAGQAQTIPSASAVAASFLRRATGASASGPAVIKRLGGVSRVWNQVVDTDTESVTIPSGHKYYAVIGGEAAIATSDGTAIAVTGGTDMVTDLTQLFNGSIPQGYTVADFQRDYPLDYYAYTTGKVLPFAAQNLETTAPDGDNVQQPLGSLAVNPGAWQDTDGNLIYPGGGMQGLGAVQDFALADADGYFRKANVMYGVVNLGSLSYTYSGGRFTSESIDDMKVAAYRGDWFICDRYGFTGASGDADMTAFIGAGVHKEIYIYDSHYTDADTFRAAMNGVMFVYQLATPVEKTLKTPVPAIYIEDKDGTEEWTRANTDEPYTSPCDMDILYPATPATSSDIATAIAAAKAEEVTALNAMLTANELGGEFSVDDDGVLTYTPGE